MRVEEEKVEEWRSKRTRNGRRRRETEESKEEEKMGGVRVEYWRENGGGGEGRGVEE
jgi:hypothetical protein